MNYTKTIWQHDLDDYPIAYYSKFDDNGKEILRIDVFNTGKKLYADPSNQPKIDENWLSDITFDEVMHSDLNDEMISTQISQDEFELLWFSPDNPKL